MAAQSIRGYAVAQSTAKAESATRINVALDWTPNTIHSGLFLAQSKGFYEKLGLDVRLFLPDSDYSKTPAKRLVQGEVDLAICPSESVIAYAESAKPNFKLQAIYAILQKDASAIITLEDKFQALKDLESGRYGSYNARYEDHIVRAMITAAGGEGSKLQTERAKPKLSLFDELKNGTVDATWIFMPWEGVQADYENIKLQAFRTEDVGIPYGYSPVIARDSAGGLSNEVLKRFVQATRRGYELAIEEPVSAAEVLLGKCQPDQSIDFLESSQSEINNFYTDGSQIGSMKEERWSAWLKWLSSNKLVTTALDINDLYTNQFH